MPITNHVTSLELSRRLKELNVPQKSFAFWINVDSEFPELHYKGLCTNGISAYLASELGEMLPNVIKKTVEYGHPDKLEDWFLSYEPDKIGHTVRYTYYYYEPMDTITIGADTECNARAKMLIYLIENHLISVEELGK